MTVLEEIETARRYAAWERAARMQQRYAGARMREALAELIVQPFSPAAVARAKRVVREWDIVADVLKDNPVPDELANRKPQPWPAAGTSPAAGPQQPEGG
jgi:hypothetical protein